jgi:hypothetical protein
LNKFFLCLISNSNSANLIWKKICEENDLLDDVQVVEEFANQLDLNEFEKNLNIYSLFFKYSHYLEWDEKCGKQINFNKNRTSFYTKKYKKKFFFFIIFKK